MGFAEYTIGQSVAGLSADYVGTEKSERESTENGKSSSSTSEAYSTLGVTAYGLVALSKSAHFKPSVNYSQLQQTDLNGFKAETDNTLSISLGLGSTF